MSNIVYPEWMFWFVGVGGFCFFVVYIVDSVTPICDWWKE